MLSLDFALLGEFVIHVSLLDIAGELEHVAEPADTPKTAACKPEEALLVSPNVEVMRSEDRAAAKPQQVREDLRLTSTSIGSANPAGWPGT